MSTPSRSEIAEQVTKSLGIEQGKSGNWFDNDWHQVQTPIVDALITASVELERLRQELKDLREDTKDYEVERSRNADKLSREGY